MKTIYSLLYVNLNAALDERVCIGIVMTNGEEHYYKYSTKKLGYISHLLSTEKLSYIEQYLQSLGQDISLSSAMDDLLFDTKSYAENWVREEYLTYLSKNSNNIISFDSPKSILLPCTEDTLKVLFTKYVFESDDLIEEHKKETAAHCQTPLDQFMQRLNSTEDLLERLDLIYDFVDDANDPKKSLELLLEHCDLLFNDVNELKTLLIISEGFSRDESIKKYHVRLEQKLEDLLVNA